MWNPLFPRTCSKAPLRVCSGVSVINIISGAWSSSIVTMSEREGLFIPDIWALIVRNERLVDVGGALVGVSSSFG